ncbi:hypothetical protein F2P81_002517 [Scophthalmus maximus]|uniref:Akirin-1 n=1 Tax=Scophthalmus maximus TaxID=52904 RepID=A0A6A4TNN9_SCOMX|nr:hypothetical protein F2P81_002517 [Scophthalmus maximus]
MSPPATAGEHRLTPEQIFQNLRQEYSRIQRRRQLEGAFTQTEACSSSDAPSPSSSLNAPSSPPGASRKDQPSFTLRQVSYLCERLLKDHEEKIREEYEQILNTKLAEQYESFVKFTQDQIMRRYGARPASYQNVLCKPVLKLNHVIDVKTKTVYFIRARALNPRQFVTFGGA